MNSPKRPRRRWLGRCISMVLVALGLFLLSPWSHVLDTIPVGVHVRRQSLQHLLTIPFFRVGFALFQFLLAWIFWKTPSAADSNANRIRRDNGQ